MSALPSATGNTAGANLLRVWTEAAIDVASQMQQAKLSRAGEPRPFNEAQDGKLDTGGCISLTRGGVSWSFALLGTRAACVKLASGLLGIEEVQLADNAELADALGEVLNIIAGMTKRKWPKGEGASLVIGLPLFLSGTDCFKYVAKGIQVMCQSLVGAALNVEVIVISRDGA